MKLAPIVIFAYNRPEALRRLISSLEANALYVNSQKFIYIDGCKNDEDKDRVEQVVSLAKEVTNNVIVSSKNLGLGTSIINGVTEILGKYDHAIVLEDDLVCSRNFLSFMNQALDFYENDNRVISISGYGLRIKKPLDYFGDVYLSGRASSWGWATWRNRWDKVDWAVSDWTQFSNDSDAKKAFNQNGSDMYGMLCDYMLGKNHSWAIRFCYSQFRMGMYSVCPFVSKVDNQGFGADATNCKQTYSRFKVDFDSSNNDDFDLRHDLEPNKMIMNQCYKYHSITARIYSKIINLLHI